ncbi:hypothetical protein ACTMSW_14415 [Micromonospora sp. BQ11]|uniref:hypothetical protein n=1 Tax=Micromonospora sp. BQ11 TaxID=3452212 RepID=UPI003F8C543D
MLRAVVPVLTTTAMLFVGAGSAGAASGEELAPADGSAIVAEGPALVLNDGTVLDAGESVSFTFEGDEASVEPVAPSDGDGGFSAARCPEVNNKPTYTVKGTPYFLEDKDEPKSTWLLPRQSVSWAVTGSHTFTWDIGVGTEVEAGAILGKAKIKVDTKISNSWTWSGTQTVTDTNSTSKAYRAVLGQVGWKLTSVKSWVAAPCTPKKKTIVIKAPRKGDMSIGRQNS